MRRLRLLLDIFLTRPRAGRPGGRLMQNGLLYPAVLMGAFCGGYVAVPINAKLHPREVHYS